MGAEPEGCYDAPPTASMKRNFSGQVCRPEGVSRGPPCGYHAGQRVDVLDTVKKWAEAEVVRVDDAARRLLVTYTYWSDKWDEWLPAESPRIAPFGSRTYQRGGAPTPGQRVEALDETGAWLEAEVLDARPGAAFVHYKGFHRKFDDWVDVGTRLREFGRTRAPQLRKRPPPPRRTYAVADGPETDDGACRGSRGAGAAGAAAPRAVPATGDVYGDDVHHDVVRRKCMDYMDAEQAFFEPYVRRYAAAPRRRVGDEPEVQALCELYDRPAEIWSYDAAANAKAGGAKVLRTFHGGEQASAGGAMAVGDVRRAPMRLSYYGGGHYDSATDAARVAAALELSRGEFEAHDDDLEATLRASLDAQDPEAERGVLQAQLDDAAVARAEEEELARALALSQEPWAADASPAATR
ncbi:thiol-dependent ubiquitin-specific protease [Aureococcus anophagefferens]|nr:thiol-dependent ubiquitin-specific protease [Aureococcus anophagefferens]